MTDPHAEGLLSRFIRACLETKLVVFLLVGGAIAWGTFVAPFDWQFFDLPRDPVPVDAIPDYGENQQIVFTDWPGRSPRDIEDQVTYPLTVALMGIADVRTVRSYSYFGFSSIHVIFEDSVEFERSRTRILEKLASLPPGTLPADVQARLGPDATALGQIFWYTLEGRDPEGRPAGGWDLGELRSIQDWQVRLPLSSVQGVSEVASIGGFVREYQIDVDPDLMRAHHVRLDEVFQAVRMSNIDVGARTIEINSVEYVIRGLGFLQSVGDIEDTVIKVDQNVPLRIRDVAVVSEGPAIRRGALDKGGEEAVGGVVIARYGTNPLAVIRSVKAKIREIEAGLPEKTLDDGTVSRVAIVPFYDRTGLIHETLDTLNTVLIEEILVTVLVVLLMIMHLRSSLIISATLPLAVLVCFVAMKVSGVDANVVALSGIAIAIGTIVDMGIILCENIHSQLERRDPSENTLDVVHRASVEVGGAVFTAVLTTVVGFLPVFFLENELGKLFRPLAYTKTFALVASALVAVSVIPPLAHLLFAGRVRHLSLRSGLYFVMAVAGLWILLALNGMVGLALFVIGMSRLFEKSVPVRWRLWFSRAANLIAVAVVLGMLTDTWLPLGAEIGFTRNLFLVSGMIASVFLTVGTFQFFYEPILRWCLAHKLLFLIAMPTPAIVLGLTVWLGADRVFGFVPATLSAVGVDETRVRRSGPWSWFVHKFPGLGREFMPRLSEGTFLYMPTTSSHASIGESMDALKKQDMAIRAIPEVDVVVGKIGRVESALDPAPISMVETVIQYKSEYAIDDRGDRILFQFDDLTQTFDRDDDGELIPDPEGRPFRQWRKHIRSEDDIWNEIEQAARVLGSTSAPRLQPIETRLIMLQTGMRAPMGVKIFGPDLKTVDDVALQVERSLRELKSIIKPDSVNADRVVGKPYLEIDIDRRAIARYGISVRRVQDVIEVAIGGKRLTSTVEGRERYPVRVRYLRELRDTMEAIENILVPTLDGTHVPLRELTTLSYKRGPGVIKGEDTQLVAYVTFDRQEGTSEVDVVEEAARSLEQARSEGRLEIPDGVTFRFAGNYENQVRAAKRFLIVLPVALMIIFLLLYLQFRSVLTAVIVFSGVTVAWAGGFHMLWLYGQSWFLDFEVFGENMRQLFHVRAYNLSVAVWVGFLALFGIATDDGVIMATYLKQVFTRRQPRTRDEVREAVIEAGKRRIRPCLMTVATTILALIPVMTSTGRGSDIMVPMAIPSFGGMVVALMTVLIVPTLYCLKEEIALRSEGE
jgi:Cu(I)/Ag(I) efflux system membrane protein CusA/SilA